MSLTMTIRVEEEEKDLIASFAKTHGTSSSDFIRKTVMEKIEDSIDAAAFLEAKKQLDANPIVHSMDAVKREFGLL